MTISSNRYHGSNPVLVTGANGFIGREVCRTLLAEDIAVRAAVRSEQAISQLPAGVKPTLVSSPPTASGWALACEGCSAVVHLIGMTHSDARQSRQAIASFREVNVGITDNLMTACFETGVLRFVYVSSIKVIGDESGLDAMLSETTLCAPVDAYGLSKREAELLVETRARAGRLEPTIIRPPLVYGPGVGGNFARLLRLVDLGIPLPFGSITNLRSMIYVRNLAGAILQALDSPTAVGETFTVADTETLSTIDLIRLVGRLMGKPARIFSVPERVLNLAAKATGQGSNLQKLTESLRVSSDHFSELTAWQAPHSIEEGLRDTVSQFLRNPKP